VKSIPMASRLSPEFRLLAACARWPQSDENLEAIRSAANSPLDWTRCAFLARRHHVLGLLHDGLQRAQLDVPRETSDQIGGLACRLVTENLAAARESLRLQRLLDEAGIPVLVIKGTALAMLAFNNISLRSAQDIDLLISSEHLAATVEIITQAGYHRIEPPAHIDDKQLRRLMRIRKDFGFIHESGGNRIELHWRLFLNNYAMQGGANPSALFAASRRVPVTDNAKLRTMGDEDLFAYLCMHGALHWWYRLKWLADINALSATTSAGALERLYAAAEDRGVERAAAQALLLCRAVLGKELPHHLFSRAAGKPLMGWLKSTALAAMRAEAQPQQRRFGTTRGTLAAFVLNSRWQYQLAELKGLFVNQTDVLTLPLPWPLWWLYPLLRMPLWAWRHFGARQDPRSSASPHL
jgi:hypothetical protein